MLLDACEVDKTQALVKRRAQFRGVEDWRARRRRVETQLHQTAADAFALMIIADDHQPDRGPVALMAGKRHAYQLAIMLGDKTLGSTLHHRPVLFAVWPLEVH